MTENRESVVSVRDAVKTYGDVRALDGFSLDVFSGETVGLIGPNGAGKSTLLESVIGARVLDSGSIDVMGVSPQDNRLVVAQFISLQPQGSSLYQHLTVKEHLILWQALYGQPIDPQPLIECVGLQAKTRKRVSTLSGGQQQRLRLALALAGRTPLILVDEPTVGLDPSGREAVWDVIRNQMSNGSVLLATQDMEEAEALCDWIVVIDRGKDVAMGTPEQLLRDYALDGSITFQTQHPVEESWLLAQPGVEWVMLRPVEGGSSVRLITRDQVATRWAIMSMPDNTVSRYKVAGPTLSDVFLMLVHDDESAVEQ